ncbi:F0F1 ATP synthase subunit A [Fluviicola chungangensis]|uniref:ATP synthase subunit a n=1 Tax=Fluviicola chungangensis TaxID=2597671 RepID=A0A556N431_9FLAO|nr:F0F1 ATP synthase subunit A [Fluviicola chungangensis]TSJ46793.1 F0F1 ATP synthase subunit A [Fluviicola chungangensis]
MSLIFSAKRFFTLIAAMVILTPTYAFHPGEPIPEEEFEVGEMIMHHISDAHEWHLWGGHHNSVSVYLPIILVDGGLKTFSSKHFYHGTPKKAVVDSLGKTVEYIVGSGPAAGYAMFEEEIYKLKDGELQFSKMEKKDGNEKLVYTEFPVNASALDFSITKNVLSLFMGAVLVLLIMGSVARFYKKNGPVAPKGLAKYLEVLIVMVRDDIAKANIHHHKYQKYVPYLLTIFFFIFINNLLGLVPFLPGGANLTGNITVTLFLAVATLLVTLFSGNRNYWGHIFAMPGVPWPVLIILIPIEIVGIFTKPFALMVRLFANMTAGHIIVLALISIIFINQSEAWGMLSVPMALFISVLELLVAFLQAFLFCMLSALFIGAAVEEAHH